MFIFDIFKQDDQRLRVVTVTVAAGMFVLLAGLWYVQIVCAKGFQSDLRRQSFRHVGIPAIRGKILDREGRVLADEKPRYNAILYLEDLQSQFDEQYGRLCKAYGQANPRLVKSNGRLNLGTGLRRQLQLDADCEVVSNITYRVSTSLEDPRVLNTNAFLRHYNDHPYVPFQVVPDLDRRQVAIFAEQWSGQPDLDLETQPVRFYPSGTLAAHLLGYVRRRDDVEGGDLSFTLPDYQGASGVERVYDEQLRGQPGVEAVLINNLNYRQREYVETPNQPGDDIYLTIDLPLQRAAEQALAQAQASVRGAVVVMDPRNGDVLVLASAPAFDPNAFAQGSVTAADWARLSDPKYKPQINRVVSGAYPPGSTFKIITGLACLENGLDPNEVFDSPGEYRASRTARPIKDTAGAGPFDFERAFYKSSNTYFITQGLAKAGLRKIMEMARRFHLGETTGLSTRQEVAGDIPDPQAVGPGQNFGEPDMCIGQELTTTPLQMAGVLTVIANGGTLFWPRVISRVRSSETGEFQELIPPGRVRDHVQIVPRHLAILRHAMLADTEHADDGRGAGTAYVPFHLGDVARLGSFRVAGKTGTAEVKSPTSPFRKITWFDSYGPYEDPRYVVVVMVEDGGSGGVTCAPVAEKIYEAIVKREQSGAGRTVALAHK
jgi:penicillin-binding protein 2